jgi:S-adenosyl-L-methionine hydrolase (adenosine-forming)
VGIMKGVILSVNPSAQIIDVTHGIDPQDIMGAAYVINAAYRYFPLGSIHVVVVDPGVGSDRSIIAVSAGGHFFLAPDNGVLGLVLDGLQTDRIIKVENETYFLNPVSHTFHGRDIFAPVAGHLSNGVGIDSFGPAITHDQMVMIAFPKPYLSESGELVGRVISVDRFGNLITNIDQQKINEVFGIINERHLELFIGSHHIKGLFSSYHDVRPQSLLAIIGSMGFVEISLNLGNALKYCSVSCGDTVKVVVTDKV